MNTNACGSAVQDVFGPIVADSCQNGFDFTLLFEEAVLTVVPLVVFGRSLYRWSSESALILCIFTGSNMGNHPSSTASKSGVQSKIFMAFAKQIRMSNIYYPFAGLPKRVLTHQLRRYT